MIATKGHLRSSRFSTFFPPYRHFSDVAKRTCLRPRVCVCVVLFCVNVSVSLLLCCQCGFGRASLQFGSRAENKLSAPALPSCQRRGIRMVPSPLGCLPPALSNHPDAALTARDNTQLVVKKNSSHIYIHIYVIILFFYILYILFLYSQMTVDPLVPEPRNSPHCIDNNRKPHYSSLAVLFSKFLFSLKLIEHKSWYMSAPLELTQNYPVFHV